MYAEEVGGEGEHRYVLMLLCSLADPGLPVFPTHRLLTGLKDDTAKQQAIRDALMRDFEIEELRDDLRARAAGRRPVAFGYMDSLPQAALPRHAQGPGDRRPRARRACRRPTAASTPRCSRRSCCAGALGMSRGRHLPPPRPRLLQETSTTRSTRCESGRADAGFFMRATPVEQVREVAEAGESMPPKSTYFYPKVPTGLVFNPPRA